MSLKNVGDGVLAITDGDHVLAYLNQADYENPHDFFSVDEDTNLPRWDEPLYGSKEQAIAARAAEERSRRDE